MTEALSYKQLLAWKESFARGFLAVNRSTSDHPMLVLCCFALGVFRELQYAYGGGPIAFGACSLAEIGIGLGLAYYAVRSAFTITAPEKMLEERKWKEGGPPLLSLFFLCFLLLVPAFIMAVIALWPATYLAEYSSIASYALMFLSALVYFWIVSRVSLAMPLICVEELGAIAGIKRSFQLSRGNFWTCAKFMTLNTAALYLPSLFVTQLADSACRTLLLDLPFEGISGLVCVGHGLIVTLCFVLPLLSLSASFCQLYLGLKMKSEALAVG